MLSLSAAPFRRGAVMLVEVLWAVYRQDEFLYCWEYIADDVNASSDTKVSVAVKCKCDNMSIYQYLV